MRLAPTVCLCPLSDDWNKPEASCATLRLRSCVEWMRVPPYRWLVPLSDDWNNSEASRAILGLRSCVDWTTVTVAPAHRVKGRDGRARFDRVPSGRFGTNRDHATWAGATRPYRWLVPFVG